MARESIDGLIARLPVNRYYVSNYAGASAVAQVDDNGGYWVVLPRDPQAPAALIVPESELQDLAAEQERGRGTWIDNVCSYGDTLHDTASGDVAGTLIQALKSAGLDAAHCATDDPRTAGWLTAHGSERVRMSYRPELFNEIRLVKSAAEIESLKQAAHANEMGLLLAFDSMAAASTPEELENFYMMTMAQQGGRGVQLHVAQGGPAVAAVGSHHPVSLA
ncbi:MAG: aminopeptidase P family N-terminal domain-containing protein, partial [Gammaproteobacteria bacterium]|nr:aminopeptidase P family N-terminal domain-containing protein [Gammaproteobacteria bacterium]